MTSKTLIIANSEFTTLTRSKAFLIGLALMPVILAIAFGIQKFTHDAVDTRDRAFVVVDRSGFLYEPVKEAADAFNREAFQGGVQKAPRFLPSQTRFAAGDQAARAALSDQVRKESIYAFVEIPANIGAPASGAAITYYSNHPADHVLASWLEGVVNREILNRRFRDASIDRALVDRLTEPVEISELGLVQRDASGAIKAAAPVDKVRTVGIPVAMMMILLFAVLSSAPQLLNSVIEEKMSRISEVLVGSVTPFELMA